MSRLRASSNAFREGASLFRKTFAELCKMLPRFGANSRGLNNRKGHKRTRCSVIVLLLIAIYLYGWYSNLLSYKDRTCAVDWPTLEDANLSAKILIVALSDAGRNTKYTRKKVRDFGGVMGATWANKQEYASKHGYTYVNASDLLSTERPPSWSKIIAVQTYLDEYDWVFWLDPDTIIMNTGVKLESLLPAESGGGDFVVTIDASGYNAGAWFAKNSEWAKEFLNQWWSMEAFVRKPGLPVSGDNDALKAYLKKMDRDELESHVRVAPQCAFNSYVWNPSIYNLIRYMVIPGRVSSGLYEPGDFIIHLAGIDDKMKYIEDALDL